MTDRPTTPSRETSRHRLKTRPPIRPITHRRSGGTRHFRNSITEPPIPPPQIAAAVARAGVGTPEPALAPAAAAGPCADTASGALPWAPTNGRRGIPR